MIPEGISGKQLLVSDLAQAKLQASDLLDEVNRLRAIIVELEKRKAPASSAAEVA